MTLPTRPQLSPLGHQTLTQAREADPEQYRADIRQHQHEHHVPPAPEYGTPAWQQLPDDDPRKLAAVFEAADNWNRLLESPYATEVLTAQWEWEDRRTYSEWGDAGSRITAEHGTPGPTYTELEQLRTQPGHIAEQWRDHHGTEHHGGPLPWEPEPRRSAAA